MLDCWCAVARPRGLENKCLHRYGPYGVGAAVASVRAEPKFTNKIKEASIGIRSMSLGIYEPMR